MASLKRKLAVLLAVCMVVMDVAPAWAEVKPAPKADTIVVKSVKQNKDEVETASPSNAEIEFDPQNWMSQLPMNYPITELTVPASHDSGTYNIKFRGIDRLKIELLKMIRDWLGSNIGESIYNYLCEHFSLLTKLVDKMATWAIETIQKLSGQCQQDSITGQLNKGIRALDLRFRYENGEFYIVHGCESEGLIGIVTTCYCYDENNNSLTLKKAFSEIRDFLDEHSSEVVFLSVQQEGGQYDYEIEKKIIQLEKDYGFIYQYAKRDFSKSVTREFHPGIKQDDMNINAKESSRDSGKHELGPYRQHAVDITNAVEDWENHWSDTVAKKKEHLKGAVQDHELLGMAQSNIMVKIYKMNDPYNECGFPFGIDVVTIPVIGIPLYVTVNCFASKLLITPKEQAAKVKPYLMNLITEYTNKGKSSDKALGLIRMDFPSASECAIIANVNTKNTAFRTRVKGETEEPDCSFVFEEIDNYKIEAKEFLQEAIEEVEQCSVYDDRIYVNGGNSNKGESQAIYTGTPGNPVSGTWTQDAGGVWHFTSNGSFRNTWGYIVNPYAKEGQSAADWFWFDANGNMLTGWQLINGKWYYLNPSMDGTLGACLIGPGRTPDGYEIDETGAWTGR